MKPFFAMPADGWYNIAIAGEFPHSTGYVQVLDGDAFKAIVEDIHAQQGKPNWPGILVDFDHDSLDPARPSTAAGWLTDIEERPDGLWAQIRWSDTGQKALEGGSFRFVSPVWMVDDCEDLGDKRLRPKRLMNCAITNCPNIKGMIPLTNRTDAGDKSRFSPPARPLPFVERVSVPVAALRAIEGDVLENARRPLTDKQRRLLWARSSENGGSPYQGSPSKRVRETAKNNPNASTSDLIKARTGNREAQAKYHKKLQETRDQWKSEDDAAREKAKADRKLVGGSSHYDWTRRSSGERKSGTKLKTGTGLPKSGKSADLDQRRGNREDAAKDRLNLSTEYKGKLTVGNLNRAVDRLNEHRQQRKEYAGVSHSKNTLDNRALWLANTAWEDMTDQQRRWWWAMMRPGAGGTSAVNPYDPDGGTLSPIAGESPTNPYASLYGPDTSPQESAFWREVYGNADDPNWQPTMGEELARLGATSDENGLFGEGGWASHQQLSQDLNKRLKDAFDEITEQELKDAIDDLASTPSILDAFGEGFLHGMGNVGSAVVDTVLGYGKQGLQMAMDSTILGAALSRIPAVRNAVDSFYGTASQKIKDATGIAYLQQQGTVGELADAISKWSAVIGVGALDMALGVSIDNWATQPAYKIGGTLNKANTSARVKLPTPVEGKNGLSKTAKFDVADINLSKTKAIEQAHLYPEGAEYMQARWAQKGADDVWGAAIDAERALQMQALKEQAQQVRALDEALAAWKDESWASMNRFRLGTRENANEAARRAEQLQKNLRREQVTQMVADAKAKKAAQTHALESAKAQATRAEKNASRLEEGLQAARKARTDAEVSARAEDAAAKHAQPHTASPIEASKTGQKSIAQLRTEADVRAATREAWGMPDAEVKRLYQQDLAEISEEIGRRKFGDGMGRDVFEKAAAKEALRSGKTTPVTKTTLDDALETLEARSKSFEYPGGTASTVPASKPTASKPAASGSLRLEPLADNATAPARGTASVAKPKTTAEAEARTAWPQATDDWADALDEVRNGDWAQRPGAGPTSSLGTPAEVPYKPLTGSASVSSKPAPTASSFSPLEDNVYRAYREGRTFSADGVTYVQDGHLTRDGEILIRDGMIDYMSRQPLAQSTLADAVSKLDDVVPSKPKTAAEAISDLRQQARSSNAAPGAEHQVEEWADRIAQGGTSKSVAAASETAGRATKGATSSASAPANSASTASAKPLGKSGIPPPGKTGAYPSDMPMVGESLRDFTLRISPLKPDVAEKAFDALAPIDPELAFHASQGHYGGMLDRSLSASNFESGLIPSVRSKLSQLRNGSLKPISAAESASAEKRILQSYADSVSYPTPSDFSTAESLVYPGTWRKASPMARWQAAMSAKRSNRASDILDSIWGIDGPPDGHRNYQTFTSDLRTALDDLGDDLLKTSRSRPAIEAEKSATSAKWKNAFSGIFFPNVGKAATSADLSSVAGKADFKTLLGTAIATLATGALAHTGYKLLNLPSDNYVVVPQDTRMRTASLSSPPPADNVPYSPDGRRLWYHAYDNERAPQEAVQPFRVQDETGALLDASGRVRGFADGTEPHAEQGGYDWSSLGNAGTRTRNDDKPHPLDAVRASAPGVFELREALASIEPQYVKIQMDIPSATPTDEAVALVRQNAGGAAKETAANLQAKIAELEQERAKLQARTYAVPVPDERPTEYQNIQYVRQAAMAAGLSSGEILEAVRKAERENSDVSRLKMEIRKAKKGLRTDKQRARAEAEVLARFNSAYNDAVKQNETNDKLAAKRLSRIESQLDTLNRAYRYATERAQNAEERAVERLQSKTQREQEKALRAQERAQREADRKARFDATLKVKTLKAGIRSLEREAVNDYERNRAVWRVVMDGVTEGKQEYHNAALELEPRLDWNAALSLMRGVYASTKGAKDKHTGRPLSEKERKNLAKGQVFGVDLPLLDAAE